MGCLVADNSYVVPHDHYILRKEKSRITVEACASIKSVKYLLKYIYKGYYCASMEMHVDVDNSNSPEQNKRAENTMYRDCRYVSALEALWRLSEYRMHEQFHTIYGGRRGLGAVGAVSVPWARPNDR